MKKHGKLLLKYLLLFVMTVFVMGCFSVSAATKTGFVTQKGKTYYINKDGSKQKGWLELKGKKYYFNKKTGVQVKGWVKDSSGQAIRYFTSGAGYMVTGFITDSNGNTRHFDETTGLLTRGWLTAVPALWPKAGWRTKKNRNAISVRPMDVCVQAG